MRTPMMARSTAPLLTFVAAAAMLLGACRGEVTSPATSSVTATPERVSSFVPTAANKALFGVVDGVYAVTFDPTRDQSFALGPNHLDIPANSVCNLFTSGYGATYWNKSCSPHTLPVTMTVVIKGAATDHPQIDFFPAMRFNPNKEVELFMYVPHATQESASNWVMKYCATGSTSCVDESKSDASLQSYVDKRANVVFRRIKHFSGYVVAEFASDGGGDSLAP
jgi:hypothetical protein